MSVVLRFSFNRKIHSHVGTGEHGVGTGKRDYLLTELGEGTVALMRTIKQTLDPHNLFNPGKVSSYSATRFLIRLDITAVS